MQSSHSSDHSQQSKKAAASGWIGSALEYYDFFIYATAASLIFPQLFFPKGDPTTAIIASLATYGVGYVARPIGAFVLGHLGDTHGRKKVLLWCMFLMGFSTIGVGCCPPMTRSACGPPRCWCSCAWPRALPWPVRSPGPVP
jgi:MFS family permease